MRFGKSDKIQFISTYEGLESVEECLPRPAKHFIPEWFKDIPSQVEDAVTVKYCPSFPDYFSQGYILPMWTDVKLESNGDDWRWESSDENTKWGIHPNKQFLSYTDSSFNGVPGQFVFKAYCPWMIVTPPGWSVLQLPLFYHFNSEWSVLPGIIDTDRYHYINQQILYHGNGKTITIKSGTPLVLYIPFKRSSKIKHEVLHQTKKHKELFSKIDFNLKRSFLPNGFYRGLQRKRDKN